MRLFKVHYPLSAHKWIETSGILSAHGTLPQIKNSEHTWGVSVQHFKQLQRQGWNNSQFRPLRNTSPIYQELSASWVDQQAWGIDWAIGALSSKCSLRLALEKEIAEMTPGQLQPDCPTPTCPWTKLIRRTGDVITVGDFMLKYDSRGAIVSLTRTPGAGEIQSMDTDWASISNPLALLRYQSVTDETFGNQMRRSYLFRHPVSSLHQCVCSYGDTTFISNLRSISSKFWLTLSDYVPG